MKRQGVKWLQTERTATMDGTKRGDIKPGARVKVVQKQDQPTGRLTEGVVMRILTNSPTHPRGIKVMLESGIVGRVKEIEE
jgi:uncharacterized repeat protein (TIGR03833 family)